jgi:hypothetical protein
MNMRLTTLALFNLGGGEIILILVLLFVLAVLAVGAFGLIYLIVRAVQNRPPPVLSTLPPEIVQNQRKRDLEHLRLLSIFHFVFAGLALLGMAFLGLHYFMMHTIFTNPEMWKSQKAGPPPQVFLDVFVWFYVFGGVILLAGLVLNVLSGIFLLRRRHRLFSLIIGALNCLQIPFGTALGVFTIIVLSRDSVRELYSRDDQ